MVLDVLRNFGSKCKQGMAAYMEAFGRNVRGVFRAFGSPKHVLYRFPKQSFVCANVACLDIGGHI